MIVTEALIEYGATKKGGWKKKQFRLFGLGWPPGKGWKKRIRGKEIPDEDGLRFVRLGRHRQATLTDLLPLADDEPLVAHDPQEWVEMCQQEYAERADSLWKINFENYRQYLDSDLWAGIRGEVIEAARSFCLCGAAARQVHHGAYDVATLLGDDRSQLFAVCGKCHQECEYDQHGHKRPPSLTGAALLEVAEKNRVTRERRMAKRKFVPAGLVFEGSDEILVLVKTEHQEALASSLGDTLVRLELDGHLID